MHVDFVEFLKKLTDNNADFIIVGAHALAFYGIPRLTGDLDILIRPSHENANKVFSAVEDFFGSSLGLTVDDLRDEQTIQFGRPPVRIDLLKNITGVTFDEAWSGKVKGKFEKIDVYYIDRECLIKNKRATGRAKDKADIEILTGTE